MRRGPRAPPLLFFLLGGAVLLLQQSSSLALRREWRQQSSSLQLDLAPAAGEDAPMAPKYDNSQGVASAEGVLPNLPMPAGSSSSSRRGENVNNIPAGQINDPMLRTRAYGLPPPQPPLPATPRVDEIVAAKPGAISSGRLRRIRVPLTVPGGLPTLGAYWEHGLCANSSYWTMPGFGGRWRSMAGSLTRQHHLHVGGEGAAYMQREFAVLNQAFFSAYADRAAAERCDKPVEAFPVKALVSANTVSADDKPVADLAEEALTGGSATPWCFEAVVNMNLVEDAVDDDALNSAVRRPEPVSDNKARDEAGRATGGGGGGGGGGGAGGAAPRTRRILMCVADRDDRREWVAALKDAVRSAFDATKLEGDLDDQMSRAQYDPYAAAMGTHALDYFSNLNAPRTPMLSIYPPAPFTICTRFGALASTYGGTCLTADDRYAALSGMSGAPRSAVSLVGPQHGGELPVRAARAQGWKVVPVDKEKGIVMVCLRSGDGCLTFDNLHVDKPSTAVTTNRTATYVEERQTKLPVLNEFECPGSDYRCFDVKGDDAGHKETGKEHDSCEKACDADGDKCKGWTYVRPNNIGADGKVMLHGKCCLKSKQVACRAHRCCDSNWKTNVKRQNVTVVNTTYHTVTTRAVHLNLTDVNGVPGRLSLRPRAANTRNYLQRWIVDPQAEADVEFDGGSKVHNRDTHRKTHQRKKYVAMLRLLVDDGAGNDQAIADAGGLQGLPRNNMCLTNSRRRTRQRELRPQAATSRISPLTGQPMLPAIFTDSAPSASAAAGAPAAGADEVRFREVIGEVLQQERQRQARRRGPATAAAAKGATTAAAAADNKKSSVVGSSSENATSATANNGSTAVMPGATGGATGAAAAASAASHPDEASLSPVDPLYMHEFEDSAERKAFLKRVAVALNKTTTVQLERERIANMTDSGDRAAAEEKLKEWVAARNKAGMKVKAPPSNMRPYDLAPPASLMPPVFGGGDEDKSSTAQTQIEQQGGGVGGARGPTAMETHATLEQQRNMKLDVNMGTDLWLWACGESAPEKGQVEPQTNGYYIGMYKDQLWKFNGFGND